MPKRLQSVQIDQCAMNYVRSVFNSMNWNPNPVETDFGVDLHVKVFDKMTRTSLPWEFKVQVKGTEKLKITDNEVVYNGIDSDHICDWISGHLPVLFVVCHVKNNTVIASYFTWVDKFVYEKLKWPIGINTFIPPQTVSVRLLINHRLNAKDKCRNNLLEYISDWSPINKTVENIRDYLSTISMEKETSYNMRSGILKWTLFALPIIYKRRGQNQKWQTINGEKNLLQCGSQAVLLLGKPATGKTITVDRLIARPNNYIIPISIKEKLPAQKEKVYKYISQTVGILNKKHIEYLQSQSRFLLIIDGLNEFNDYKNIMNNIIQLRDKLPDTRFIVTCRVNDYDLMRRRLKGFEEWEIADLNRRAQDSFLSTQSDEVKSAVYNAFKKQPNLRELCKIQFLFLIAVELISSLKGLPLRRVDLYHNFLSRYLKWMKVPELETNHIIELLSKIAFMMRKTRGNRTLILNSKLSLLIAKNSKSVDKKTLMIIFYKYGLIEKIGKYSKFFQETLQEYLCAYYLVTNGILPCELNSDKECLSYDGMILNDEIRSFYIEIGGFDRLTPKIQL
jgi:hypothetical protein